MVRRREAAASAWLLLVIIAPAGRADEGISLLERYPPTSPETATGPEIACAWEFDAEDILELSRFTMSVGPSLQAQIGSADVGIGHCAGGAVWALVIPRKSGWLSTSVANGAEAVDHVWLRFNPSMVEKLFPKETVVGRGQAGLRWRMRWIAWSKVRSSWHVGNRAMIPESKDGTVDFDTSAGRRRFFAVDWDSGKAEYVAAFEARPVGAGHPLVAGEAETGFNQLWETFDRDYPMFVLRPEVRWDELGERYRDHAAAARTREELAVICSEMLAQLRDLHVGVEVNDQPVPGFERPRAANANPAAHPSILGGLESSGRRVSWARTNGDIGYVCIQGWDAPAIPEQFDAALERLRDTRGLILDVRLNGGGDERLAQAVAGRFTERSVVYSYSRSRNGPKHFDLTEKRPREVGPRGPWAYHAPVIVLIGQKCMSSNESFVAMMDPFPQVTTMGDRTAGSSGNPARVELPAGLTATVPRWIDHLADGEPLDERGIAPDVFFPTDRAAFEGERDDLLRAALERLRPGQTASQPSRVR